MPAGLLILYDDLTMPTYKILIATKVRKITHKNFILFRCTLRDVLYHGLPNHVLNGLQMLVKSANRIAPSVPKLSTKSTTLTCITVQIPNHKSQRNTEFVCYNPKGWTMLKPLHSNKTNKQSLLRSYNRSSKLIN